MCGRVFSLVYKVYVHVKTKRKLEKGSRGRGEREREEGGEVEGKTSYP